MRLTTLLRLGPLALACFASAAWGQIEFKAGAPGIVQGGAGTVEFTLHNSGSAPIPLNLSATAPTDETSHVTLTNPKVTLRVQPGTQLPKTIGKGETLLVAADISNMIGSNSAQFRIFNGNSLLGSLEAVAADAAMNISIDRDGSASAPLTITRWSDATITLKNGDPQAYSLAWSLQIRGMKKAGTLKLPANGSAGIVLSPDDGAFLTGDYIRPTSETAQLLIWANDPVLQQIEPQTRRALPVKLTMRPRDPDWTVIWSNIYVGFFLLLGGALSVIATSVLPNLFKKGTLRGQLAELANRTSSVSTRVDSYLRVLLRVERKKIDVLLEATTIFSFPDSIDEINAGIEQLTTRLTVAERLDQMRRALEEKQATAPPSIADNVDAILQTVAESMHSFALPQDVVAAANKGLDDASAALGTIQDIGVLGKKISESFKDLTTRIANLDLPYADLKTALPGIFKILQGKFNDPNNITLPMVYSIDFGIAAINTAIDYAVVRASMPKAGSKNCADPGADGANDITGNECRLIELLGTMSWQTLREARLLVQQMREGIYEDDVLREIGRAGQAEIVFDTQKARRNLPVYFSIDFKNPRFNHAAAITQLDCDWTFPFDLKEKSWKVCHFFQGNEPEVKPKPPAPDEEHAETHSDGKHHPHEHAHQAHKQERKKRETSGERIDIRKWPAQIRNWIFPPEAPRKIEIKVAVGRQKPLRRHARAEDHPLPHEHLEAVDVIHPEPHHGVEAQHKPGGAAEHQAHLRAGVEGHTKPGQHAAPHEDAASVKHEPPKAAKVELHLTAATGTILTREHGKRILTGIIEIQPPTPQHNHGRMIAFIRFWIAFGIALAALLSGAVDQLQKLDLVPATFTVIGLGFGADALKNLLTLTPKKNGS